MVKCWIKARTRELHTSLAGSTMMLISNLAEAHCSLIAAARQATLQDISKLIWIVMLAGLQYLKCITL